MGIDKQTSDGAASRKTDERPASTEDEQRPVVTGDRGQDDAYATESHPEGLRYGEKAHKPGELPHPKGPHGTQHEPLISVGDE